MLIKEAQSIRLKEQKVKQTKTNYKSGSFTPYLRKLLPNFVDFKKIYPFQ